VEIREKLGIREGDEVEWALQGEAHARCPKTVIYEHQNRKSDIA
jgi:bifunctional DNA-binding transcriptional regulator/antitoxin component of YhaV-PrlF toxin-antitoxin module